MSRPRSLQVAFVVLSWLLIAPLTASAEWFADLYGGVASTGEEDVVFSFVDPADGPTTQTFDSVEFDTSASFGGRVGYWFEESLGQMLGRRFKMDPTKVNLNIGLALDVSHFRPDIDQQVVSRTEVDLGGAGFDPAVLFSQFDVTVTPISFDFMLRWPVSNPKFRGQLEPYFTIGPTLFIADAEDSGTPPANEFDPAGQSADDTALGLKVGVGLGWRFSKNLAVFGEYRFTHVTPEFEFNDVGGDGPTTVEMDLNTHHFIAGISYRF